MKQYNRIKSQHEDAILFFRMGDFYETFFEDAKIASKELNIVLTAREKGDSKKIPLAGVPHHAADSYIERLIKKGYKVAICEQVEDPALAQGIVKREVVRVITPGTLIEDSLLKPQDNNYLMAISVEPLQYEDIIQSQLPSKIGLAFIDISTGEFTTTQIEDRVDLIQKMATELARFKPSECLVPSSLINDNNKLIRILKDQARVQTQNQSERQMLITPYQDDAFVHNNAYHNLTEHFNTMSLEGLGLENKALAVSAAGAALSYIQETQKAQLSYINQLTTYSTADYMILDATTLRNLEIIRNIRDGSTKGTLIGILDHTVTSMGSRLMRKWVQQPLINIDDIKARQDAVEELSSQVFLRRDLIEILKTIYDLERLISRVVYGSANARDLIALKLSLKIIPEVKKILNSADPKLNSVILQELATKMDDQSEIVDMIEKAIINDPPATVREGGLIKDGYNEELDLLRDTSRQGKKWISALERQEQRKTRIKTLKVGYNKIFGYYIEVSKANLSQVPPDYIRKQTLVNAERFVTPELKEKESLIISAEDKIEALEYKLFTEIRDTVGGQADSIQSTSRNLAKLDVLISLAETAIRNNYVRPEVTDGATINIKSGRHPVVEQLLDTSFIPNDTHLNCNDNRLIILTGPNMAGKSTYMRQVALITIMAQVGSYVSSTHATIGVVDRVFTRVGAFDDLTRGQSTFMVEMLELANILNNATSRSLILLDEIGRGTSTFDGLSIAWSVAEFIHNRNKLGTKTLFATHYHHLNELAEVLNGVKNYNIAVKENKDDIIFLYKVQPGGANQSFGIQVAQLAGMPADVIVRAKEVLAKIESEDILAVSEDDKQRTISSDKLVKGTGKHVQLTFVGQPDSKLSEVEKRILDELKSLDMKNLTPLQVMNKIYEMQVTLCSDRGVGR
jgi:DNA mismatch repair protein MutS